MMLLNQRPVNLTRDAKSVFESPKYRKEPTRHTKARTVHRTEANDQVDCPRLDRPIQLGLASKASHASIFPYRRDDRRGKSKTGLLGRVATNEAAS